MTPSSVHRLASLVLVPLLFSLLFGRGGAPEAAPPAAAEAIENRFFTLDFQSEGLTMAEVERHFFTTFPHDDPTQGDVVYDRKQWVNEDMLTLRKREGLFLYIKDRNDGQAYDSNRLTSKAYYNLNEQTPEILFVFKGAFPSARGVWPAWWLNGGREAPWTYEDIGEIESDAGLDRYSGKGHFYDTPSAVNPTDWPGAGEIDIIETINGNNVIHNTIHTCPQMCDSEWNNDGIIINCANAVPGDPNSGCSGKPYQTEAPEGTFACLWGKNSIHFFYWKPGESVREAGGPLSADPDPEQWREGNLVNAVRLLETDAQCTASDHQEWQCASCATSDACIFTNMKVIFNITLCGKWAGTRFDNTGNAPENCKTYLFGEGKSVIHNQFIKIEYFSVSALQ